MYAMDRSTDSDDGLIHITRVTDHTKSTRIPVLQNKAKDKDNLLLPTLLMHFTTYIYITVCNFAQTQWSCGLSLESGLIDSMGIIRLSYCHMS